MRKNNESLSRTSKLKFNAILMLLIKGMSMLISLLYVPLLLNAMESSHYAIWLTLTSVMSWITMFDIGLGNGLRNKLAQAISRQDFCLARRYISTAYVTISIIIFFLFLLFCILRGYVQWDVILMATNLNLTELDQLVMIVFFSCLIHFALNLINSILYALQYPALSSFISLLGQLSSFIIVYVIVKHFNVNSILILGSVVSIVPALVLLLSTLFIFSYKLKELSPSIKYFEIYRVKEILSLGIKFFILQIITIVLYQTNNIIILHFVGDYAVVEYNIVYRYMFVLVTIFNMIATPLWSATTEAYVKGEFDWIRMITKKMNFMVWILSGVGVIMILSSDFVYRIWLGESTINISLSTTIIMYLYSVFMMFYGVYGYIINGIGKLSMQIIITTILSLLYIPLAYASSKYNGLEGILLVFMGISSFNFLWAKIQYGKLINNTAKGIWNS